MRSDTQAVTIAADPKEVLAFVGDGDNLPRWAIGFAKSVRPDGDRWIVTTGQGEVPTRIDVDERTGTVDFHMEPAAGAVATAFSRVVPNGDGAELTFTQLQQPGTPDEVFEQLVAAVAHELVALEGDAGGRMSALTDVELRRLAFAAGEGDPDALALVLDAVRDDLYRLALRMLWHPEDAEDATQEALIRIMTRIGSYRGEAAFGTWAYRVAANHILKWRQSRVERENLDFHRFGEQLHEGLADPDLAGPDARILAQEVKLGCTLGMLLCLDRDHRLAYVLSDVFEMPGADAAYVCDISPAVFRKRASRARQRLQAFVTEHCGLVNRSAACRCERRVAPRCASAASTPTPSSSRNTSTQRRR